MGARAHLTIIRLNRSWLPAKGRGWTEEIVFLAKKCRSVLLNWKSRAQLLLAALL